MKREYCETHGHYDCVVCELHEMIISRDARIKELESEREQILLEVFGGEDAPGYAAAQGIKQVRHVMESERQMMNYLVDENLALESSLVVATEALKNVPRKMDTYLRIYPDDKELRSMKMRIEAALAEKQK